MTIARLYYLTCNNCGTPAGTGDDMSDTAAGARKNARAMGWYVGKDQHLKALDLCTKCRKERSL